MNRQELLNQIEHYTPFNEQEEMDKQLILNWIRNNTNAFSRDCLLYTSDAADDA